MILKMTGFDDCILGLCERFEAHGRQTFLVYDVEKVIEKLMRDDGMTREEAEEFYDFNQAGAYAGTPGFVTLAGEDWGEILELIEGEDEG